MGLCQWERQEDGRFCCEACGRTVRKEVRRQCLVGGVPARPTITQMWSTYKEAVKRWRAAGKPVRPDGQVAQIHDEICVPCEHYNATWDNCELCGCQLSKTSWAILSKIRMMTERCPVGKWGTEPAGAVLVIGIHRSLSGCLAVMLERLGVFMGSETKRGEDRRLAEICEEIQPFPSLEPRIDADGRQAMLREWFDRVEAEAGGATVGLKYPTLCGFAEDVLAVRPDIRIVHAARPLADSFASLVSRSKAPGNYHATYHECRKLQRSLSDAKQAFLAKHAHLTVVAEDLLRNPQNEVDRIVHYLGISPNRSQHRRAAGVPKPHLARHAPAIVDGPRWTDQTTVIVKTFERPDCLDRCVASIREYYPAAEIIVADDSRISAERHDVQVIPMKFDSGLSAGRNRLVAEVDSEYVLLCDDDFVFTAETDCDALWRAIRETGLDVVAGRLRYGNAGVPPFCGALVVEDGVLYLRSEPKGRVGDVFLFELVENFFIARTASLRQVPWNDDLKVGEHLDWALHAREAGLRIGCLLDVFALNDRGGYSESYKAYRGRGGSYRRLSLVTWGEKLGFSRYVNELDAAKLEAACEKAAGQPSRTQRESC